MPGEDERAMECFEELSRELLAKGYPPYRTNVSTMQYADGGEAHAAVVRGIKAVLDPGGVLAPGRYAAVHGEGGTTVPPSSHTPA